MFYDVADYDDYPSYSPSGKWLAFTFKEYSSEDGWFDYVDVIRADGTNRQLLTWGGYRTPWLQPAFSPDGKRIVYADSVDFSGIVLMRSDGTHRRLVTDKGVNWQADPSFVPSGKRIVFVSTVDGSTTFRSNISTIKLDGSHRHRLTAQVSVPYSRNGFNSPDVSPDGTRIVFGRGTGIYVMRSDGSHQRRLADGSSPVFSPNGKRIAFTRVTGNNKPEIIVMRADGSDQHALVPSPLPLGVADPSQLALGQPSWGPRP